MLRNQKGRKAPVKTQPHHQPSRLDQIAGAYEASRGLLPQRFVDKLDTALNLYKGIRNSFTPFGANASNGPMIGTPEQSQTMFNMSSFEFRSGGKDMHGPYTEAQGCELVTSILGSATTQLFQGPVTWTGLTNNTVGLNTDAANGRLGQISGLFNEYQFQWGMFEYVPQCSVTQPGAFVLGYIEDGEPAPTPVASYNTVIRMRPSVVCKFSGGCVLPIKVGDRAKVYQTEYLKAGDRLEDCVQGTLYGYPQGASVDTTTVFGQLLFHYNVRLYKPTFQLFAGVPRALQSALDQVPRGKQKDLLVRNLITKCEKLARSLLTAPEVPTSSFPAVVEEKKEEPTQLVLINGAPATFQVAPPQPPPPPNSDTPRPPCDSMNPRAGVSLPAATAAPGPRAEDYNPGIGPVLSPTGEIVAWKDYVARVIGPAKGQFDDNLLDDDEWVSFSLMGRVGAIVVLPIFEKAQSLDWEQIVEDPDMASSLVLACFYPSKEAHRSLITLTRAWQPHGSEEVHSLHIRCLQALRDTAHRLGDSGLGFC